MDAATAARGHRVRKAIRLLVTRSRQHLCPAPRRIGEKTRNQDVEVAQAARLPGASTIAWGFECPRSVPSLISLVIRCREWNQATDAAVPGMCRAQIGCAVIVPWCAWDRGWQALQVVDS